MGGEGLELGSSRRNERTQHVLLQLGKKPNVIFTVQVGKRYHRAVLALRRVKPSAGAGHATITLPWPAMHFCVVLLCAFCWQPLIKGSLQGHLQAGNAAVSNVRTLSPGLRQAVAELGAVVMALPGSNTGDGAQWLLHPLLLPNLLSIKPQLCTVLHCTMGSSKYFLPCGFCLTRAP